MRIGKKLHFSPNYTFLDLNLDESQKLIDAFKDRVTGFYICPAELLNRDKRGFATGILCITTIDYLSKFKFNGSKRMIKWLKKYIDRFKNLDPNNSNRTYADRFFNDFRNGLIHEGRIKNAGQFSYDCQEIAKVEEGVMEVNPAKLLSFVKSYFNNYLIELKEDDQVFHIFKEILRNDFAKEIKLAKKI